MSKTQKWYLKPHRVLLSIIRYGSRAKWSKPENRVAPSPTLRCSSYWKRSVANFIYQLLNLIFSVTFGFLKSFREFLFKTLREEKLGLYIFSVFMFFAIFFFLWYILVLSDGDDQFRKVDFIFISYRLEQPSILFMCLSVSFLIIPSDPIITRTMVVLWCHIFSISFSGSRFFLIFFYWYVIICWQWRINQMARFLSDSP